MTKDSRSSSLPDTLRSSDQTLTKQRQSLSTSSRLLPLGQTSPVHAVNIETGIDIFEDDTTAEQAIALDSLVELVTKILHKRPGSTASLHNILIGPDSVEQFRGLYSSKTFQLLRAVTKNSWASTTIIVLSDEGYKSIAVTANTKTILFVRFQEGRFKIGYWVLVRADLRAQTFYYYDSIRQPPDIAETWTNSTCDEVKELLNKARHFRGLDVIEFNPEVKHLYVSFKNSNVTCGYFYLLRAPTYAVSLLYDSSKLLRGR